MPSSCRLRRPLLVLILASGIAAPSLLLAHEMHVQPYLQRASPSSIFIHWETSGGEESVVEWGPTEALGNSAVGSESAGPFGTRRHEVELTGLQPGTRYWYRTVTEDAVSSVYDFITPAEPSAEESFRILAVSDMQRSSAAPDKFREIIEDGVLGFVGQQFSEDLPAELGMTLVPGDLVDTGWSYGQFAEEFFAPGEQLFPHVPLYPVPGNHEADSPFFFDYFNLPPNGTAGYLEHWWHLDRSNVRVVGLDSNSGYRVAEQLDWLDGLLAETCDNEAIDFVFAQLHHPFKSELWLPGELDYTGSVVERLEEFSTACGKPSIHFFGHTHGYSRGQSRDHNHLWVNVATAGGAIDDWGDYPQADYAEFVVSHDDWGFVIVEVEAGETPSFRLRRVSRGDEDGPLNNVVRDDLTIRLENAGPAQPTALEPSGAGASPDQTVLVGSAYSDPEGDEHGATHWQIAESCEDWSDPVLDRWVQYRNEYFGTDLQEGDDLTDEVLTGLSPKRDYCWRLRYRDRGLGWSSWSEPVGFTTGKSALSDNLLQNPGAEDGKKHWTVLEGTFEVLTNGECDSVPPYAGTYLFAVGGVCEDEGDYAEVEQRVPVGDWAKEIDDDRVAAFFGGWMRAYNSGNDLPEFELVALDEAEVEIQRSDRHGGSTADWAETIDQFQLPVGTRFLVFTLRGTRKTGSDNDSYFDDLELRLHIQEVVKPGDDDDASGDDDDDATDDDSGLVGSGADCGCSASARSQPAERMLYLAGLLLVMWRGRRSNLGRPRTR